MSILFTWTLEFIFIKVLVMSSMTGSWVVVGRHCPVERVVILFKLTDFFARRAVT